jgi:GT2 family glycosyltransferase
VTTVGVVVVTYRSEETIDACLVSLRRGRDVVADVVIVDNASDDATLARAATHGVRTVRNTENRGFAAAANQGCAESGGDYVLFLNPDAELHSDCVARLADALDTNPALGIVGPARIVSPAGDLIPYWPFPRAAHTWFVALGLARLRPPAPAKGFVVGTCMLVRRELFERLGGFDEEFWMYGEDADLCRRALAAGAESAVVPGTAIDHIGGHSSARGDTFEAFHRGTELFIAKYYGGRALASHRVADLFGAVVRSVVMWPTRRERSRWFARLARRQARLLRRQPTAVAPR